ncbi:DUF1007 domain-containing protein [Psychromonas sp. B3M02]|uniref:DUF1007 family protein n=1 Tax=Psychromonas sp. B3M02 TaxID=2267226 RepID=UPI000DE887B5|nr:DUF1007 family protein [Psychromonas sp. B3M02]RBW47226.1 DUF1007 domain-containing protein [Psychromonas sp. B3M02]
MKTNPKLLPFIFILSLLMPIGAQAHPHSWINMKTKIEGNEEQITGLTMSWTFDSLTSAYMLDGENLSAENKAATFKKLKDSVMENINVEHYFTYFYDGETPIKYAFSNQGTLTQNGPKLTLDFYVPLSKPKAISDRPLKLAIFEPSYYVDMSWDSKNDIELSSALSKRCSFELIPPNPTPEQVTYAMSLSVDQDPDNALGQLFTQTVIINCLK